MALDTEAIRRFAEERKTTHPETYAHIRALLDAVEERDAMLRKMEWGSFNICTGKPYCFICGAWQTSGHNKNCDLAALLARRVSPGGARPEPGADRR